jgi:DNA-directed RNA polymerase subunit beta'
MVKDFKALRIKLASPEDMLAWSFGEVTKAETINYRTFRPEVDGLMDEKIFGPTKDYECFCGKYKKIRYKGIVCDRCGVEVTTKRVRRERMGHVRLITPVTHVWFAHGVPNRLSLLLDIPQKKLETVIYYARYLVTAVDADKKEEETARLKEVREKERAELETELADRLKEVESQFAAQIKQLQKEEKDEKKFGVQAERVKANERKELAHVKSAYNQKIQVLDEKFEQLGSLIQDLEVGSTLSEEDHRTLEDYGVDLFTADMGAPAVKTLLQKTDLDTVIDQLDKEIIETRSQIKKARMTQRKRMLKGMQKAGIKPEWVILDVLPVLPPDLRPIIQLPGGRFATSDLNDLYRRVINRNNRLKRLIELGAPQVILRNERRMLQESVDALLDNSHRPGSPTNNSRGLPYKSLSDQLRGKQGRFRQNLLGKRVDYSGRAVIVPGPDLTFYQCGLPKTIALELFKPFILRELIGRGIATNPARAKILYDEKIEEVWDILEEVSINRPVMLNRAPTLHKQGIVAFYPVLIEGNAIQLHPMMCRGYNADFDGDQMAVHLPLSQQAVEEIKERMMAHSNMLSMADGSPIVNTEKDMAMGIYFLTLMKGKPEDVKFAFASRSEAVSRYTTGEISLYEPVKLKLASGRIVTTTVGRAIFNTALPDDYPYINETLDRKSVQKITADVFNKYGRIAAIESLDKIKELGFKFARVSGFSPAMSEFQFGAKEMVETKLTAFRKREDELLQDYYDGLITKQELSRLRQEEWISTSESIGDETWALASKRTDSNLVHLNNSGATPVSSWVKNISGVKGYVTDISGNVVDLPLMGNYESGLSNFEYFVHAKYTRKSYADVALRTADSGYLTRRLVDAAQDLVVQAEDCGSTEGVAIKKADKRNQEYAERLQGRYVVADVANAKTAEVYIKAGELIDLETAAKITEDETIEEVVVRSPLNCSLAHGICVHCYGKDFGTGELVRVGEAVGIVAAQSIGEPTTQLTLKNKSDARARGDVTQGLPRVEELFELRTPKVKALIADIDGNLKVVQNENDVTLRISSTKKLRKTYDINEGDVVQVKRAQKAKKGDILVIRANGVEEKAAMAGTIEIVEDKVYLLIEKEVESEMTTYEMRDLVVQNGEYIERGQRLTYGSVDPKELAEYIDVHTAQKYIIDEVQAVYSVYGIPLDDLHLEVILSQMGRFGKVVSGGDSIERLVGEYVDVLKMDDENTELVKEGKKQVQYERTLLGLTNAALRTESFLSAASFQQQVRVLTDAALVGKIDYLRGLKENVIIGRPVPIGSVLVQKHQDGGNQVQNIELSLTSTGVA